VKHTGVILLVVLGSFVPAVAENTAPQVQAKKATQQKSQAAKKKKANAQPVVDASQGAAPAQQPQESSVAPESVPAPVATAPATAPSTVSTTPDSGPVDYGDGIDTLDVESGGNWLQKRVIWEDAQRMYEKVKGILGQILEARLGFYEKRSQATRELNVFFAEMGTSQGALTDELGDMLHKIEQERAQWGQLSEQESALRIKLLEKKRELEQLGTDLKLLASFDTALDTALQQMLQQINVAVGYDRQAWDQFKAIGQELDDRKAKYLFVQMTTAYQNMEAILQYFQGAFAQYLQTAVDKIAELRNASKATIEALQKDGVDLTKRFSELQEAEQKAREEQLHREKEAAKKAAAKKGWIGKVEFLWQTPATWILNAWDWTTSWFGGKKVAKPAK
jgi:hypothetical protein